MTSGAHHNMDLERLSLPCGGLCGIPIRLHLLLPAAAVMAGLSALPHGSLAVLLAVLVAGPLTLLTVLTHELGHVLAAKRCGCSTDHILLWPLGGLAFIGLGSQVGPKGHMGIAAAGPATHLPMLGLWLGLLAVFNGGKLTLSTNGMYLDTHFVALLCVAMLNNNIAMLLFNLLVPCFPLDCSRILASALLLCGLEPGKAAQVIVGCSVFVLLCIIGLSIWSYLSGMVTASLNLFLALWLGFQTWRLHQSRLQGNLGNDPLFSAISSPATTAAGSASQSGGAATDARGSSGFRSFQGGSQTLGSSSGAAQVGIGAVISLMIAMFVSQVGVSPTLY